MRVILLATGVNSEVQKFVPEQMAALLPLLDRPFVQHVIERLSAQGAREFDVVLSERPELFEALLGDGTRWGVRITYHLARDPEHPWLALKALRPPDDLAMPVLLADAETLPLADFPQPSAAPMLFSQGDGAWTGWGWLPWSLLAALPGDLATPAVAQALTAAGAGVKTVPSCLSVRTHAELLRSSREFLGNRFPGLLCRGREVEPGIWLSRNVQIRPGARIEPPVYIGENSRIGRAVVGPGVVIGQDCVVDDDSVVQESLVLPSSYIGQGLDLHESLVDRNCMVNCRVGVAVTVSDNFLLGNLSHQPSGYWWQSALARLFAGLLLVPALPLTLVFWGMQRLAGQPLHWRRRMIACLPVPEDAYRLVQVPLWDIGELPPHRLYMTDFLLRVVPGLARVLLGGIHLTGIDPVLPDELEAMQPPRRNLCRKAKAGLISESLIVSGAAPSPDDRYAAEAFYAVTAGFKNDLKLMGIYAWRMLSAQRLERKANPSFAEPDDNEEIMETIAN